MNIFYLHNDPKTCAQQHVDKHVVKMILEYGQLLSTAHRICDGNISTRLSKSGRKQKFYSLPDNRDSIIYSATHANHPSAKWCRHGEANYKWLYALFCELLQEYTYRYGKQHATSRLVEILKNPPKNINKDEPFSPPWRAMPDEYKVDDTMQSYRNYYLGAKSNMFSWKKREVPEWITK